MSILILFNVPYTNAYHYTSSQFENHLFSKDCSAVAYEIFNPPDKWQGEKVNKDLFIKNTSKTDTSQVARVRYTEYLTDDNGTVYSLLKDNGEDLITKGWTDKGLNNSNYWYQKDGWYYYRYPLKSGEEVQILDFIEGTGYILKDATYTLTFEVEIIPIDDSINKWELNFPIV